MGEDFGIEETKMFPGGMKLGGLEVLACNLRPVSLLGPKQGVGLMFEDGPDTQY